MLIPFSNVKAGGGSGSDPFADSPDGADLAADSNTYRTSNDATPALRPTYNFHNISVLGTEIMALAGGDDVTAIYNILAFTFPYYGAAKSTVRINTNGCLSFAGVNPVLPSLWSPASSGGSNTLPHDDDPDDAIFPLMKDYEANHVYTKEVTSPNRLIIQWDTWDIYASGAARDVFQCVLHEDGAIYFYYATLGSNISGAQNVAGHTGVGWDVSPFIYGCQNSTHTAGVFIGGSSPVNDAPLVGDLLSVLMAIRIKPRT